MRIDISSRSSCLSVIAWFMAVHVCLLLDSYVAVTEAFQLIDSKFNRIKLYPLCSLFNTEGAGSHVHI